MAHGYAIVLLRSKHNKKFYYQCDRSGYTRSKAPVSAQTSTTPINKIGCPFKAVGTFSANTHSFFFQVKHPSHNHPASQSPSSHAMHRRPDREQKKMIHELTKSGAKPLEIKARILEKSTIHNSHIRLDSIYNERKKISRSILQERPPIEALFDLMSKTRKFELIKSSQEGLTN
ncbi:hypothetical protein DFH28DRAFT_890618, partial [Melampsora americana]